MIGQGPLPGDKKYKGVGSILESISNIQVLQLSQPYKWHGKSSEEVEVSNNADCAVIFTDNATNQVNNCETSKMVLDVDYTTGSTSSDSHSQDASYKSKHQNIAQDPMSSSSKSKCSGLKFPLFCMETQSFGRGSLRILLQYKILRQVFMCLWLDLVVLLHLLTRLSYKILVISHVMLLMLSNMYAAAVQLFAENASCLRLAVCITKRKRKYSPDPISEKSSGKGSVFWLFMLILYPVNAQVAVFPSEAFVSVPGESPTLTCLSPLPKLIDVQWLINGSLLETLDIPGVQAQFSSRLRVGNLAFMDIPEAYNNTRISCIGIFISGERLPSVDTTVLLLQGNLSAVVNLTLTVKNSTLYLTWQPPFSFDLTAIETDILYCVDVISVVSGVIVYSECDVVVTTWTYAVPSTSWCDLFEFVVIPTNLAGNGTFSGVILLYGLPELEDVFCIKSDAVYTLKTTVAVCTVTLTFVDLDGEVTTTLNDTDLTISGNNITFSKEPLTPHRRFDLTIRATNVAGQAQLRTLISTHGVADSSIMANSLVTKISTIYSECFDAGGALFSFVFITDDSGVDCNATFLLPLDRNTSLNYTLPFDLYPGLYRVYVYDIEQDGTLSNGVEYPAVTNELFISGNNSGGVLLQEKLHVMESCSINNTNGQLIALCSYPNNSVAVGFLMIVQLIDVSEDKLYTSQSRDPLTAASVMVERNGMYKVTIFSLEEGVGILNSSVEFTEKIVVNDVPTTSPATRTPNTTTLTIGLTSSGDSTANNFYKIIIPVIIMILCCYWYYDHPIAVKSGDDQLVDSEKGDTLQLRKTQGSGTKNYGLVGHVLDNSTKKRDDVDVGQVGRSTEASQETNHRYSQPQTQLTRYPDGESRTQSQNPGEKKQNVAFRPQDSYNPDGSLQLEDEMMPEDEKGRPDVEQQPRTADMEQQPKLEPDVEQQPASEPDIQQQPVPESDKEPPKY